MKNLVVAFLMIGVLCLSGCAKNIEIVTVEKERVDQNLIEGNKGFFMGTPPPQDEPKYRSSTRTIYQIKVELPEYAYKDWSKYKTVDKELWGNRGYIYGGAQIKKMSEPAKIQVEKKEVTPILLPQETVEPKRVEPEPTPVVRLPQEPTKPQKNSFTTYVVQKNDTLGKVSKKVYGTAAKWQMIYEANKDVLKNPNKIYPGQKLRIPR